MNARQISLVIAATAGISVLTMVTVAASGATWMKIAEMALSIALVAFLLLRASRHAVITFALAASVIVANQMLLAQGYLTFLNAGQAFSASSFGPVPASIGVAVVVSAVTSAAFYIRRLWAYVAVIAVLIAVTWPTPLAGLSI